MLREHSNRNDTLRVIKCPLFLCLIIKPGNHRRDQDHILQSTARTSRMRQTFLSKQTKGEGRRIVGVRKRDFIATLVRAAAEPSSAFSLTVYCTQHTVLPTSASCSLDGLFMTWCLHQQPLFWIGASRFQRRSAHLVCILHCINQCGMRLVPCTITTGNCLLSVCQATGNTDCWCKNAVKIIN